MRRGGRYVIRVSRRGIHRLGEGGYVRKIHSPSLVEHGMSTLLVITKLNQATAVVMKVQRKWDEGSLEGYYRRVCSLDLPILVELLS